MMRGQRNVLAVLVLVALSATLHTMLRISIQFTTTYVPGTDQITTLLARAKQEATLRDAPEPAPLPPSSPAGYAVPSVVGNGIGSTAPLAAHGSGDQCRQCVRLLVWNVQQASAKRASDLTIRALLGFASLRGFDLLALNELWHDESEILALSHTAGYPHVALHRGKDGSRLGLISAWPLQSRPVEHRLGHGALCATPTLGHASNASTPAADAGAGAFTVCVVHLSSDGEKARLRELPSLLAALPPSSQPTVLVGDLNSLSPLDFSPERSANVTAVEEDAPSWAGRVLRRLRGSRKLTKKFLSKSGGPALQLMGSLLRAGFRDLQHLAAPRGAGALATATWAAPEAQEAGRGGDADADDEVDEDPWANDETPPPPPPAPRAAPTTALRLDYALGNEAFVRSKLGSAHAGVWATVLGREELRAHSVDTASEHLPLEVMIGQPWPAHASAEAASAAAAEQSAVGARFPLIKPAAGSTKLPSAMPLTKPAGSAGGGGKGAAPMRVSPKDAHNQVSEREIASMPGGIPSGAQSAADGTGARGTACSPLGEGPSQGLARLKSDVESDPSFVRRCQALSGMLRLLKLRRRLRSCAIVGGSGILRSFPQGGPIDQHEAVLRVNNCPVRGFERLVGSKTTVRFVNGPRSLLWAREVDQTQRPPVELLGNEHIVVWGEQRTVARLASSLPRNASVVRANTRFRRECADKTFWSAEELDRHRAQNHVHRLEITFGFEAVAHALYACERVSIYGFYLDPSGAERNASSPSGKGVQGRALEKVPYHYYENQTYDKNAKDPWKPWTYRFHNFELEHEKFRQLGHACWLKLVSTDEGA